MIDGRKKARGYKERMGEEWNEGRKERRKGGKIDGTKKARVE